jgi:hypothetical protein
MSMSSMLSAQSVIYDENGMRFLSHMQRQKCLLYLSIRPCMHYHQFYYRLITIMMSINPFLGDMSTCVITCNSTCDLTCDSVPVLA